MADLKTKHLRKIRPHLLLLLARILLDVLGTNVAPSLEEELVDDVLIAQEDIRRALDGIYVKGYQGITKTFSARARLEAIALGDAAKKLQEFLRSAAGQSVASFDDSLEVFRGKVLHAPVIAHPTLHDGSPEVGAT